MIQLIERQGQIHPAPRNIIEATSNDSALLLPQSIC
jgi:hypothetical protein